MNYTDEMKLARQIIAEAREAALSLAPGNRSEALTQCLDRLRVEWSGRFSARMGDAHAGLRRIRLSRPLWPHATPEQRRNTVLHELAHIVSETLFPGSHHNWQWRRVARALGCNAMRCHSVERPAHLLRGHHETWHCACTNHLISTRRAAKWAEIERRRMGRVVARCKRCRQPIARGPLQSVAETIERSVS